MAVLPEFRVYFVRMGNLFDRIGKLSISRLQYLRKLSARVSLLEICQGYVWDVHSRLHLLGYLQI